MKKMILAITLIIGALQADNVVHYDTKEVKTPISKPNHPNNDIY